MNGKIDGKFAIGTEVERVCSVIDKHTGKDIMRSAGGFRLKRMGEYFKVYRGGEFIGGIKFDAEPKPMINWNHCYTWGEVIAVNKVWEHYGLKRMLEAHLNGEIKVHRMD